MSIHSSHPTVLDFKRNEVNTLEYIFKRKLVKDFIELDKAIQFSWAAYKNDKVATKDFYFYAEFPIMIEKHIHQMYIGGKVIENYDETTYFMAIGNKDDPSQIVRKFHFDFAQPSTNTNQLVPIFHLQYGGKLPTKMRDQGLDDSRIDAGLSIPRLNYAPVNLAILLDIAFTEFRTEQTKKLVEKNEWRQLIYDNEAFILQKYYCGIANFCKSSSYTAKYLIRDFCYGKT